MLPDAATLYIAGATRAALDITFWQDVYGFTMKPVADSIVCQNQGKAIVTDVPASSILTESVAIRNFDLCFMHPRDADFSSEFELPLLGTVSSSLPEVTKWIAGSKNMK